MNTSQDREYQALLALLRAGLWEKAVDDLTLFPLSDEQWKRVYTLSCEQTVSGIIYRGISHLPEDMMPSEMEMIRWAARVDAIERRSKRVNHTLNGLHNLLVKHNLHPILQKGYVVAQMYANPLLRESGDIDLWFQPQEWDAARALASTITGRVESMADGCSLYFFEGIEIEHHRKFFDIQNPAKKHYLYTLFEADENRAMYAKERKEGINKPSPLANIVLQNTHILKHSLGLGIGLRQLCDLARTYYTLSDVYDGEQLKTIYKKLGLKRWSNMLHSFLVEHIGLEPRYLPYQLDGKEPTTQFAEIVKRGGNFGQHSQHRISAGDGVWSRKFNTLCGFLRSLRFAIRYAPLEFGYRISELTIGQLRR
ncbi:MAG: nucleotidyltransferase family protein [Alistipes sp.]|nr:nucleotidyltransferase family protein [Alistipes sp.]